MRVLLDGKQWGLPDTEEAQLIVEELEGHIISSICFESVSS